MDLIPADAKRQLERLTQVILRAKAEAGRNLYEIGRSLREVQRADLWRAGPYDTFDEYLADGADLSRSMAYRLMRVADHFNAPIVERYGVDKLDAAMGYMRATGRAELPGDVLAADIRLRNDDGRYQSVPLHEASGRQIREATKLLRADKAARRAPSPAALAAARDLGATIPAVPGVRRSNRATVKRARDGTEILTIRDVPLSYLEQLGLQLVELDAKLDDGDD